MKVKQLLKENNNIEQFEEDPKEFLEELFDENEFAEAVSTLDEMGIDYNVFSIENDNIVYIENYNILVRDDVIPDVYQGNEEIINFVEEINLTDLEIFFNYDPEEWSQSFWNSVGPNSVVWHNTTEENYELIERSGVLRASNQTRGLLNRGTQSAVFVTTSADEAAMGVYGNVMLEIDLNQMKQDGHTPFVSREEPCVEFELRNRLLNYINPEIEFSDWHINMDGIDCENTLVIFGNIPIKYIKREN